MENSMFKIIAAALVAVTLNFASPAQGLAAGLVAHVDISSQTMTVSSYGQTLHVWRVSTAGRGYHTPTGSYRPTRMARMWYSRKYDNSPMPYSVFFRGGYAIHGTGAVKRLGTPASHGCVRLHPRNAATLFSMIRQTGSRNTRIIITR
jgi:lipoprotein-anchoring transpeptidase ErfK/SrfK